MTKREQTIYKQTRTLQTAGYNLQGHSHIKPNTGSEKEKTLFAKTACFIVLQNADYVVESEIKYTRTNGVCDLLAYGLADRRPIVVEIESENNSDLKLENVELYGSDHIREVYTFFLDTTPTNPYDMIDYFTVELGL